MVKVNGKTSVISYVRDAEMRPIVTFVAYLDSPDKVLFGWSKVATTKSGKIKDIPDKKKGIMIAFNRAPIKGMDDLPENFHDDANDFTRRVVKYFKQVNNFVVPDFIGSLR